MVGLFLNIFNIEIEILCGDSRINSYLNCLYSNHINLQSKRRAGCISVTIVNKEEKDVNQYTLLLETAKFSLYNCENNDYLGIMEFSRIGSAESLYYNFCLPLLKFIMNDLGYITIHAAGIEVSNSGILLCGNSNSGKSTLSTIALLYGGRFLNDDIVFLNRFNYAYSFYRPIHILPFIAELIGIGDRVNKNEPYIKNRQEVNYFYQNYHLYNVRDCIKIKTIMELTYNEKLSLRWEYIEDKRKKEEILIRNSFPLKSIDNFMFYKLEWGLKLLETPNILYEFFESISKV